MATGGQYNPGGKTLRGGRKMPPTSASEGKVAAEYDLKSTNLIVMSTH